MAESKRDRVNRELGEFLQELRVALPGAEVLFAFLLGVAFSERFETLAHSERRIYFIAACSSAVSIVLLIAPTAHHRLRFRTGNKEQMLRVGTVLAVAGTLAVAVATTLSLHVLATVVFDSTAAAWSAGAIGGLTVLVWYVLPLMYRGPDEDGSPR